MKPPTASGVLIEKKGRGMGRLKSFLKGFGPGLAGLLVLAALPASAAAGPEDGLAAERRAPGPRFGLAAAAADGPADPLAARDDDLGPSGNGPSPALAGLLSGVVPGAGQLALGQNRGWAYLGVEFVSWFSFAALRSAGNQSETDYREFADAHWDWDRYLTVTDCGEGLGPRDFEAERTQLDQYRRDARQDYYDAIGRDDVYACGWDGQPNRSDYLSMQDDANRLFRASRWVVGALVLNHLVSAVDAAKSASARRRADAVQSFRWEVRPTRKGDVALRAELSRRF